MLVFPEWITSAILGIVEGLTEFLPVSSTGHLILAGHLLGASGERWKTFEIFIQLGAVLAVLFEWRRAFLPFQSLPHLALRLLAGFLPAAVIGLLAGHAIKAHLFNPFVVASALLIGAIVIFVVESRPPAVRTHEAVNVSVAQAFGIGLCQCFALIPGTSRAMTTILGGMLLGIGRSAATEFSFLLAIPTMFAAGGYDLLKSRNALALADAPLFAIGFVVSFVVALLVVRWLIGYVRTHDFRPFAWWRIAVGVAVLVFRGAFTR